MSKVKRIAIVTGHFPPSNLAGVHRARLWSQHLPEFGWDPIIVTTHPDYYEEKLDPALMALVSPKTRIIHTKAIPVRPLRVVGDIGLRAFYWHLKAIDELVSRKEIDFLHITIPSNYAALLGQTLYRRYRMPFGIDYQDPWVNIWPGVEKLLSKAWISQRLATWLEPWAVKNAVLITGVSPSYYEGMLDRNPHLQDHCVTAAMPIGNSELDYQVLQNGARDTFLFSKGDGLFHMVYAGAMLPKAYPVLDRLLKALVVLRDQDSEVMERLRIHFVGTGTSSNDTGGYNIRPHILHLGLERWVDEHPSRIGYVDVLNHLTQSSAILILGSTEAHYTPSKVYQSVQSKRPIFALLHEQSSAVQVLRESRAGSAVVFNEHNLPDPRKLAEALASFIRDPQYSAEAVNWDAFEAYSAHNSARVLASAIERALELHKKRRIAGETGRSI